MQGAMMPPSVDLRPDELGRRERTGPADDERRSRGRRSGRRRSWWSHCRQQGDTLGHPGELNPGDAAPGAVRLHLAVGRRRAERGRLEQRDAGGARRGPPVGQSPRLTASMPSPAAAAGPMWWPPLASPFLASSSCPPAPRRRPSTSPCSCSPSRRWQRPAGRRPPHWTCPAPTMPARCRARRPRSPPRRPGRVATPPAPRRAPRAPRRGRARPRAAWGRYPWPSG